MSGSKAAFRATQALLSPLLFGSAGDTGVCRPLLGPVASCLLVLDSLAELMTSSPEPSLDVDERQSRGTASPAALQHLLIELVPQSLAEEDVRSCTPQAAALLARSCVAPSTARMAVKLVQSFRLRLEDLKDSTLMVQFVAELLNDPSTLSPAVGLMLSMEVCVQTRPWGKKATAQLVAAPICS